MERGDAQLFNDLKKLTNDQELTPGDHFECNENNGKKRKSDMYQIQKEVHRRTTRTTLHSEYSCLRQCLSNPTPVARHSI